MAADAPLADNPAPVVFATAAGGRQVMGELSARGGKRREVLSFPSKTQPAPLSILPSLPFTLAPAAPLRRRPGPGAHRRGRSVRGM